MRKSLKRMHLSLMESIELETRHGHSFPFIRKGSCPFTAFHGEGDGGSDGV